MGTLKLSGCGSAHLNVRLGAALPYYFEVPNKRPGTAIFWGKFSAREALIRVGTLINFLEKILFKIFAALNFDILRVFQYIRQYLKKKLLIGTLIWVGTLIIFSENFR